MSDDDSPGWAAIETAMGGLYGEQEGRHLVIPPPARRVLGGREVLEGISYYRASDHWHVVTFGLTDLHVPGDDAEVSGVGFELTARISAPDGPEPPTWVAMLLGTLANYVADSGRPFAPGHVLPLNRPIAPGVERLRAVGIVEDPELPARSTPHGSVAFLQVVPMTDDEVDAGWSWSPKAVLDLARVRDPLLRCAVNRVSWLEAPDFRAEWEAGVAEHGSDLATAPVGRLSVKAPLLWGPTVVRTTSAAARMIAAVLPGRLAHGRAFDLTSPDGSVTFAPGPVAALTRDGRHLVLTLPDAALASRLRAGVGTYDLPELGLRIEVVPVG